MTTISSPLFKAINRMNRFAALSISLILCSFALSGQGLYNNGAKIVIKSGSSVVINGHSGNYRNETHNSDGTIDLSGTLKLGGNFTNNVENADVFSTVNAGSEVIFAGRGSQTIGGTSNAVFTFGKVTVNNGDTTQIMAGKDVTLTGAMTNNGTFILKSDPSGTASFIDNGTITGSGIAKVEKYLTSGRWWYIGSPVVSTSGYNAYGPLSSVPSTGTRELYWNENTHAYVTVVNSDNLVPMKGYAFREYDASPLTASYTGNLNTGTIGGTTNLSRTTGTKEGFNLISNPYPSAIRVGSQKDTSSGLTTTNIEPTIQFKVPGTFATWNSMGSGAGVNGGTQYIPAMQAFWVRVKAGHTTGGIQINNAMRVHNYQKFFKLTDPSNLFRIQVARDTMSDESVVTFYPSALAGFDDYDSQKMLSDEVSYPQLYSLTADNSQVAINGQPDLVSGVERIVPMGFLTNVAGTFTISATNLTQFDANTIVYLEDVTLHTTQNLSTNKTYTFTSGTGTFNNRFKLHFNYKISNPLPIQLLSFDAKCTNNTVDINWSTATETNNDYFTIERSTDASDWTFVAKVAGSGNSNNVINYTAKDITPVNGISYYRLKQTDFNGQTKTFNTVIVNCSEETSQVSVSYYPNPFTSEVSVEISNAVSDNAMINVYDVVGRKVFSKTISKDEISLKAITLNLADLTNGVYFVEFTTDGFSGVTKVVKH